jgi:hypothetical protein
VTSHGWAGCGWAVAGHGQDAACRGAVANSYHFAIFSFFHFFCIYNMSICYFYDLFSFFHF